MLGPVARLALLAAATTACYAGGRSSPGAARVGDPSPEFGSTAAAWRDAHPRDMAELLEGRFPGVEVRRLPGGGTSLRIRGASSPLLGTEPLIVIDGLVVSPGPGGALPVEPEAVERIEIVHSAAASAAWGSRGANGALLITTKRR